MSVGYLAFGLVFFLGALGSIALMRQEAPFTTGVVTTACVIAGSHALFAAITTAR